MSSTNLNYGVILDAGDLTESKSTTNHVNITDSRREDENSRIEDVDKYRPKKLYVFLFLAATYINYCNLSMIAPFYPMEAAKKGLSETVTGLVFAVYSFSIFVFSLFTGKMILKLGAKQVLLLGYSLSGACNICFGLLDYVEDTTVFATISFIIRAAEGFGVSAAENSILVLLSMMYPENGSYYRGLFEMITGVGFSMGPLIGGILFELGGFSLPFYTVGVMIIINVTLISVLFPYRRSETNDPSKGQIKKILMLPNTMMCSFIGIIGFVSFSVYFPTLEVNLQKFELNAIMLGLVFLCQSAFYAVMCPISGWIIDKYKTTTSLLLSALMIDAVFVLFLGPSLFIPFIEDSLWLNFVTLAGLGAATAMIIVAAYQKILDGVFKVGFKDDEVTHSVVASIYILYYSLGGAIGPAIGGAILDYWNFSAVSSFVVIISLCTFLLSALYFYKTKNS